MRNGHSSAVDQTGVPVYRGSHAARGSSLVGNSSITTDSRQSLDESREHHNHGKVVYSNDNEDSGQFTKFKSRRSLPWYQSRELQVVGAITLLSLIVRLWAIDYPTSVV
jgi:dolichyl-phosphate-mannose-protein mannosyltransferase